MSLIAASSLRDIRSTSSVFRNAAIRPTSGQRKIVVRGLTPNATTKLVSDLAAYSPSIVLIADAGTGTAGTWSDQSGNGRDAAQATTSKRPTLAASSINGRAAFVFDGVDDWIRATFTLAQPTTIFIVYKNRSVGASGAHDVVFDGATSNTGAMVEDSRPLITLYAGSSRTIAQTIAASAFIIAEVTFNGTNSSLVVNGQTLTLGGTTVGTGSMGGITLGALGDGTRNTSITVAAVVMFASDPSTGTRTAVRSALGNYYGITVP